MNEEALVKVKNLNKFYKAKQNQSAHLFSLKSEDKFIKAVDDVSFSIRKNEVLALVGESGSGKTTIGKVILNLYKPTSGQVLFKEMDVFNLSKKEERKFRRKTGIIFQHPFASLDPRRTIGDIISLPFKVNTEINQTNLKEGVVKVLESVGLQPAENFINRYPHELSGGQRQRVAIARVIIKNPEFIVADEIVASLDASIRAQILNLMKDLKNDLNLTYLLITHDLSVTKYLADRVMVMYLGKNVELSTTTDIFDKPLHPYTKALISSIPELNEDNNRLHLLESMPNAIDLPSGCRFHPRCPYANALCSQKEPKFREIEHGRYVACHNALL